MSPTQVAAAPAALRAGVSEPIVRIERLEKRFPRRTGWRAVLRHPRRREWVTVLDSVSCDVREGEFFGLLGPNGAGKTTLFKTLSTLITPDGGRAWIAGHEIGRDPGGVRGVLTPVVPEERSLHWRLTARQNLIVFAALHGLPRAEAARRIEELLAAVGLDDTGAKLVAEFSSGMRQRLLLARALLARPRVLLLDEPTRSLDPISARGFRAFLRQEIVGRQGCTVLLATHNAEEALELCDRVGVLDRGRLLAVGAPGDLARRLGEDRYRMLLRPLPRELLRALEHGRLVSDVTEHGADADGWTTLELRIAGGADGAADALAALNAAGAGVALLERIRFTLADLIEGIVAEQTPHLQHAHHDSRAVRHAEGVVP
jgi:ABC-2 type transport system ATP-binding protein